MEVLRFSFSEVLRGGRGQEAHSARSVVAPGSMVPLLPLLGGGGVFASAGVWFGAGAVEIGT